MTSNSTAKPANSRFAKKRKFKLTEELPDTMTVVDEFRYQEGDRIMYALLSEGRLLLRAQTAEGSACAINLDGPACHRLAITLSKYLELHKLNHGGGHE